jgi:hypothetical protein
LLEILYYKYRERYRLIETTFFLHASTRCHDVIRKGVWTVESDLSQVSIGHVLGSGRNVK